MRFSLSSTALSNKLVALSRVINSKNPLPILADFLFEIKDNTLYLTASDSENTVKTSLELTESDGNGSFAVGNHTLLEAVKTISEQPITIEVDTINGLAKISYQNGLFSLPIDNSDEYPQTQEVDANANTIIISSNILSDNITRSVFATGQEEIRRVMNGIYFDLSEEKISLVATDAHRLVRYINHGVKGTHAVSFILPKKPAQLLKQVLQKEAEEVKVTFGQKNAKFEFGTTVIVCRQIEGRFPNYNAVIPQNNTNKVLVDRQTIVNACKRVAVFANTGTSLLKLALSENQIKISAQDIDFSTSAEETISCDYTGMPMAIGFKAPFLIEILANVASQEVVLQLADPARAGLILPAENEEGQDLLILLMPMLLND